MGSCYDTDSFGTHFFTRSSHADYLEAPEVLLSCRVQTFSAACLAPALFPSSSGLIQPLAGRPCLRIHRPHSMLPRSKLHHPSQHDGEPIAKSNKKINVDAGPQQPRREPGRLPKPQIGDGERTPHHGQVALVPIPEGLWPSLARGAAAN